VLYLLLLFRIFLMDVFIMFATESIFLPPQARLAGSQFVCLIVCPLVCYQISAQDISKRNELILMPIGTSGPWDKGLTQSTLGVRRSKVKVTRGQNRSHEAKDRGLLESSF